jgi:hypothetical protein
MGVGFRNICSGCGTVGVGLGLKTLDKELCSARPPRPESLSASDAMDDHIMYGRLHWQRRARLLLLTLGGYANLVLHCQYLPYCCRFLASFCDPFKPNTCTPE